MTQQTQPKMSAREVLDMIRRRTDRLYDWRQQFINEEQWQTWCHTPEGTAEILADLEKGQTWFVHEDTEHSSKLSALIQRLRSRHG